MHSLRTPPTGRFKIEFDLVPVSGFSKLSFIITMSHQFSKKRKISAITGKLDLDSDEEREVELHAQLFPVAEVTSPNRFTLIIPHPSTMQHTQKSIHTHM